MMHDIEFLLSYFVITLVILFLSIGVVRNFGIIHYNWDIVEELKNYYLKLKLSGYKEHVVVANNVMVLKEFYKSRTISHISQNYLRYQDGAALDGASLIDEMSYGLKIASRQILGEVIASQMSYAK